MRAKGYRKGDKLARILPDGRGGVICLVAVAILSIVIAGLLVSALDVRGRATTVGAPLGRHARGLGVFFSYRDCIMVRSVSSRYYQELLGG